LAHFVVRTIVPETTLPRFPARDQMISGLHTVRWAGGKFLLRTEIVRSDRAGTIDVLAMGLIGWARAIDAKSESSARSAGMLTLVIT
jgi:hypothetical protein